MLKGLTNRAISHRLTDLFKQVRLFSTADNVYALMLIGMGFGILARPESAIGLLRDYAHTQVSSEFYAMLLILVGGFGINRRLTTVGSIGLTFPFVLHTLLAWGAVILRDDAAISPAVIYTAVCIWRLNQNQEP
jgi:hypothetical protein